MKDVVRYHPVPGMPGMVLGQARITEFQFDRHYHVDYHIGLVTQGCSGRAFAVAACYWGRAPSP